MFKFLYTAVNQFESSKLKENAKDKLKKQLIYMYACLHESLNLTSNIYTDCLHINNFSYEIIFYTYYFIICLSTKAVF